MGSQLSGTSVRAVPSPAAMPVDLQLFLRDFTVKDSGRHGEKPPGKKKTTSSVNCSLKHPNKPTLGKFLRNYLYIIYIFKQESWSWAFPTLKSSPILMLKQFPVIFPDLKAICCSTQQLILFIIKSNGCHCAVLVISFMLCSFKIKMLVKIPANETRVQRRSIYELGSRKLGKLCI